jgi:hypothetical protein
MEPLLSSGAGLSIKKRKIDDSKKEPDNELESGSPGKTTLAGSPSDPWITPEFSSLSPDAQGFLVEYMALKKYKCFDVITPMIIAAINSSFSTKRVSDEKQLKIEQPSCDSKIIDAQDSKNNPPIIMYNLLSVPYKKKYVHDIDPAIIVFMVLKKNMGDGEYYLHRRARTTKMTRPKIINVTKFISQKIIDDCSYITFRIDDFVKNESRNKFSKKCFFYELADTVYDLLKNNDIFCGSLKISRQKDEQIYASD